VIWLNRNHALIAIVIVILLGIYYFEQQKTVIGPSSNATELGIMDDSLRVVQKAQQYQRAKELVDIAGYINADESFKLEDYIGKKVILLDIWTYTCINCQRTLPYITAWHEKYKDAGLLIVGVHSPEFEFEKEYDNVVDATKRFNINYPVVQDNNFGTWRAYENRWWPRKFLIDIDGFVVYDHIGEGAYDETERKIQELLQERSDVLGMKMAIDTSLADVNNEENSARSPETYFGAWRNNNFGNGVQGAVGIQQLELAQKIDPNTLYLTGIWDIQHQHARSTQEDDMIHFLYGAKNVFLVARADTPVDVQVLLDGNPHSSGEDVVNGVVTIHEDRLYKIVNDAEPGVHVLQLKTGSGGVEAFAFTFG
jgi:thiol-disulfide isomerase/thioredoxin